MSRTRNVFVAACCIAVMACSGSDTATGPGPTDGGTPSTVSVASVVVSPTVASVIAGQSTQLTAVARDASNNVLAGRALAWSSSAANIATVSTAGLVTAVSAGAATITVTSEGRSAQAVVTVQAVPAVASVASVAVATALDTIEAYDVVSPQAVTRDSANNVLTGRTVRWTSSNPAVASVDNVTGVLTGVDRGTVTVTATSEGKSGSATRVVVIRYRSLSAGTSHACNIASGGIAWCWGLNGTEGRIGSPQTGDGQYSATPVRVPGDNHFVQLATYGRTTCGVRTDFKAYCWGSNNWGALGVASSTSFSSMPVPVSGNLSFKSVSAGGDQICGVTTDNRGYCWGNNSWGQFGNGTTSSDYVPQPVSGAMLLASVTAGSSYSCGVTMASALYCWGADGDGQQGLGLPISYGNTYNALPRSAVGPSFATVQASQSVSCGLTAAGAAYCWGSSTGGRLGSEGSSTSTPRAVAGGLNFRSLSVGSSHVCGVASDFAVYCWGMNGNGQLGATSLNGGTTPVRAGGDLLASEVSAANISTGSASYTCAESKDRLTTYCWGRNDLGQLGNGRTTSATAVNSLPSIVVGQKPLPAAATMR